MTLYDGQSCVPNAPPYSCQSQDIGLDVGCSVQELIALSCCCSLAMAHNAVLGKGEILMNPLYHHYGSPMWQMWGLPPVQCATPPCLAGASCLQAYGL